MSDDIWTSHNDQQYYIVLSEPQVVLLKDLLRKRYLYKSEHLENINQQLDSIILNKELYLEDFFNLIHRQ